MLYAGELEEVNSVEIEEMEVHWKIPNFNSLPRDKSYRSPDFQFFDQTCVLELDRPKDSITYGINVWFYIDKREYVPWVDIMYTLGIIKADGTLGFMKSEEHYDLSYENSLIEVENFFTRSALQEQEAELMPSNNLTILCKLERLKGFLRLRGRNAFLSNIKGLFTNKEHCDVTLQLADEEFQAHKFILAAQSPVFSAMFKHDTSEKKTGVVKIFDCNPNSFGDFLKYLYSGDFRIISDDNVLHLYKLSGRYGIQDLKEFCLEHMNEKFIPKNHLFNVAIIAEETDDQELYAAAQKSFIKNIKEILTSDEWMTFLKECSIVANKLLVNFASKAHILHMQDVKNFSLDYMRENLNRDHFFDAVIIAEETSDQELYAAAQNFFNRNAKEILSSDVWMTYLKEHTVLANKLLLGFNSVRMSDEQLREFQCLIETIKEMEEMSDDDTDFMWPIL